MKPTTKKRVTAKPSEIPAEFRQVMEERKQQFGVSYQFTLRKALAYALANRPAWDAFFSK